MLASHKRKIYGILVALIMQFSLYSITETERKIGTGLAVALSSVAAGTISSDESRPVVIGATFLISGIAVYSYLKKYTPTFRENTVKAIIREAEKDPFVSNYKNLYSNASMSEKRFRTTIDHLYQKNIKEERYPLMIAFNSLIYWQSQMEDAGKLMQKGKGDAIREGLLSNYTSTEDDRLECADNIRQSIARIVACEDYPQISRDYEEMKHNRQQLAIKKRNAAAREKSADAAQDAARSKGKQSDAFISWKNWQIIKDLFCFFFGKKQN